MPAADSYRNRYRGQRDRGGGRRQEPREGDAVVMALTAQVLVCVLLLLAAHLMKRAEAPGYERVRSQYDAMVSDQAQTRRAVEYFTDSENALARFFEAVENGINALVDRFDRGVEEDLAAAREEAGAAETQGTVDFGYDYLERDGVLYASLGYGRGGAFPVALEGGLEGKALPAPEGSVLSPVVLTGRMLPPVTGLVTSPFAYRYHPISGSVDFHTGIDIAAAEGTNILAALPGEVVEVGESEVYGHYIILQHAINLRTFYAHCSEILAKEGMQLRQGERIAKVGQTGTATGPHLHFSVIVEGQFTDPTWVLEDNIRLVEE